MTQRGQFHVLHLTQTYPSEVQIYIHKLAHLIISGFEFTPTAHANA